MFCRREAETECAARGDVGIRALPKRSRSDKLEDALDTQVRVGIRVLPERSRNQRASAKSRVRLRSGDPSEGRLGISAALSLRGDSP